MPDYNPKDVPTLDDIIEKDLADNVESDNTESDDAVTEAIKNDLDSFSDRSIDPDTADTVIAETKPQAGDLNDIPDAEPGNTEAVQYVYEESCETSVFSSEDKTEDGPDNTESTLTDYNEDEDKNTITDLQSVEPAPQVSVEPISLELIVNDIVKQLMPDLEQQLKSRLQQALEEKLPEEIIKSADTTHEN